MIQSHESQKFHTTLNYFLHFSLEWKYFKSLWTLTLIRLGYFGGWKDWGGGGGGAMILEISAVDRRENLYNGSVRCNFRFSKIFLFYFILIKYANLCKKSDFLL